MICFRSAAERVVNIVPDPGVLAQHNDLVSRFGERSDNPAPMNRRHGEDKIGSIDKVLCEPAAAMRGNIDPQPARRCARIVCRREAVARVKSGRFCSDIRLTCSGYFVEKSLRHRASAGVPSADKENHSFKSRGMMVPYPDPTLPPLRLASQPLRHYARTGSGASTVSPFQARPDRLECRRRPSNRSVARLYGFSPLGSVLRARAQASGRSVDHGVPARDTGRTRPEAASRRTHGPKRPQVP